ncbi:thymidylate synthase [Yellowstone lake phycodnavirus 1]|uniref:thymidylate synthase n=1 Tax=Yellowstone lake phycodnavirus 1 TaxID=1586713 RepID=UPI0006EB5E7E|nr:thymidylate synthase [Yellowstone lake phycodnavirus 1]BAT22209.1 putative FAD-dependent thymidylate synthase [Yellowstone lake phycodnavirus 1]
MSSVRLVDSMGDDAAIVQAARVSYAQGTKSVSDDRGLIRYLMRHRHTTPFEMVDFKFHIKCPIFVARQWLRHRTASVNEVSARYSILPDEFYMPENLRLQSTSNKQGGEEAFPDGTDQLILLKQKASCDMAFHVYDELLSKNCSRELARAHLPLNTFTEFYWKINLHNLLHFLELRMDGHAQKEIRDLAVQVYDLIKPVVPVTCEAFEDYHQGSVTFSKVEIALLKDIIKDPMSATYRVLTSKGENAEFQDKLKILGFI